MRHLTGMTDQQIVSKIAEMLGVVSEYHGNLQLTGTDGPVNINIEVNTKTKRDAEQLWKLAGVLGEIQKMIIRKEHWEFTADEVVDGKPI